MKENITIINHSHMTCDKIYTNAQKHKNEENNNFQSQNQTRILHKPNKSLFTSTIKNPKPHQHTQVPYPLSIKLNKGVEKDGTKKHCFRIKLPHISKMPLSVYQSQSKSPIKKRDFSSISQKVNQAQIKPEINKNITNETSGTTSAEEKSNKQSKMSILYEFEKATLIIQKNWKGREMRKRLSQILKTANYTTTNNINNINNNKESKLRPKLLDINENEDNLLSHSLSNVSRLSINTQDLEYDSSDNDYFVDSTNEC